MFKMVCPVCKLKMKDSIDIFDNKNISYECPNCKASLKKSSTYAKIGELLPVIILTFSIIIRSRLNLTNLEKYLLQPIIVTVLVILAYILFISLYPKKLHKK